MKKALKVMALAVLAGGTAAVAMTMAMNAIVDYAERCDQKEYMYCDDSQYD